MSYLIQRTTDDFLKETIDRWISNSRGIGWGNLFLSNMNLSYIPPDLLLYGCSKLNTIYLSGNKLTTLPHGLFSKCPDINSVYLGNNQLTSLPDDLFTGCYKLKNISLYKNKLEYIPVSVLKMFSKLGTLSIDSHLLTDALFYVNDLDNVTVSGYSDGSVSAYSKLKKLISCIKRYRRNPKDSSSLAWTMRRFAIVSVFI